MIAWVWMIGAALAAPTLPSGPPRNAGDPADGAGLTLTPERAAAAKALGCSPQFLDYTAEGLELLYARDYRRLRTYFAALDKLYPNTGVSGVADVLTWQAIMLENFDFRYHESYVAASATARKQLDAALALPGNEAWEHLMYVGVAGIEAIHAARRSKYFSAITLAFEALDHIGAVRRLAPEFVDIRLADGLYHYWRSALSDKLKALPDFGDQRALGYEQMTDVAEHGAFLGPPARLSLAFSYLEERRFNEALTQIDKIHAKYPNNVINELMRGILLYYANRNDEAKAVLTHLLEIEPDQRRAHYYLGAIAQEAHRDDEARSELERYLSFDGLQPYQISRSEYRLGRIAERAKRWSEAVAHYERAVKADNDSGAKSRLADLRKRARAGEISY